MQENDPLKKSLDLWRVNPPVDGALAAKIREKLENRKAVSLFAPTTPVARRATTVLSNSKYPDLSPTEVFASPHRQDWNPSAIGIAALLMLVALLSGVAGSAVGTRQRLADTQAIVALYLSKINPM